MNHIVLCCYTCLPRSTSCNKLMWLTCQFVSLESIQHFCPHIVRSRYASVQIPLCYLGSNPSASAVKLRFVLKTNRTEAWLRPFLISRKIDTRDKDNPFCLFRVEQRDTCLREAYRTCSPTSRAWICGNYPSRCDSPYKLHVVWSRSVSRKQNVRSIVENAHLDNIECNCLHLCSLRQGQQHQVRLCLTRTLRRESKPLNMHPVRRWFSERPGPKASSKDMYVGIRAPCCHLRV